MKYLKEFLYRGLVFGGFGPIVMALIYCIIQFTSESFLLTGTDAALAIVSTYLLAFIHAGASVFNSIESWSVPKSLGVHFSMLYFAYITCYLINRWIPFDVIFLIIFTLVFITIYFAVWITVYVSVCHVQRKLNKKL